MHLVIDTTFPFRPGFSVSPNVTLRLAAFESMQCAARLMTVGLMSVHVQLPLTPPPRSSV